MFLFCNYKKEKSNKIMSRQFKLNEKEDATEPYKNVQFHV